MLKQAADALAVLVLSWKRHPMFTGLDSLPRRRSCHCISRLNTGVTGRQEGRRLQRINHRLQKTPGTLLQKGTSGCEEQARCRREYVYSCVAMEETLKGAENAVASVKEPAQN